uniref:Uncharacterized protein n=1 Tax=Ditylenchus dipsaci TaxID=166011 RepID=A0A915DKS1_9BILA
MVRSSGIQRQFKWTYSAYQVDFNGRSDRLWLIHVQRRWTSSAYQWTSSAYQVDFKILQLRWTSTAYQVDSRAAEMDHNGNLMDFQRSSSELWRHMWWTLCVCIVIRGFVSLFSQSRLALTADKVDFVVAQINFQCISSGLKASRVNFNGNSDRLPVHIE